MEISVNNEMENGGSLLNQANAEPFSVMISTQKVLF